MIELLLTRDKKTGTYTLMQDGGLALQSKDAAVASEELTRRLEDFVAKKKSVRARIVEDGEEEVRTYGAPPPEIPPPHVPRPLDPIRIAMKAQGIPISPNVVVHTIQLAVSEYPTPALARAWVRKYGYPIQQICLRSDPWDHLARVWYVTSCDPCPDGMGFHVRVGDGRYAHVVNPDIVPPAPEKTVDELTALARGDVLKAVNESIRARDAGDTVEGL